MARRIVRASYTIDRPTFGFDMMIPIWKQFAVAGLPSNLPFLFTDAANGHPNPELISGLDPDVETLLIINITVTANAVVGSLGKLSSDKQTNLLWDPLRTVYRWTSNPSSYVYDKSLTDSVGAENGWYGPSQTQANFYPEGRVYNFDYDSTEIKTNGVLDAIDIFNLTSFGPGYPFPYALTARNANNWIVKFPVVGTVISDNPTGTPDIGSAAPAVTDIIEHHTYPGMNHLNSMAAMHIGVPPSNKWKVQINIKNNGIICGMGGEGGNGANYTAAAVPDKVLGREYLPTSYDGGPGGDAIDARAGQDPDKTYPADWIRVNVINLGNGKVFAGGGGGGGGAMSQKITEAFALVPSGAGGGGSAGAGLTKDLFELYWLNYTGATLDAYNQLYRFTNTTSFDPVPRWALGGRGGQGGTSFHSFNNSVEESYKGNYNGSSGANGKDPINNNNLDLIGGPGGGNQSGPGAWQSSFTDPSFTRNVGATWYPGGHKGGKGGNGGDFGLAGSNGSDSNAHQDYSTVDPSNPDRYYGYAGRGGAAGRAAIYSDNVTVNIRSAKPRNVKGTKTKIDPV